MELSPLAFWRRRSALGEVDEVLSAGVSRALEPAALRCTSWSEKNSSLCPS